MDLEHVERRLRERLGALGPAPRAELLHVLMLPDFDRADRIGELWGNPKTRTFAESRRSGHRMRRETGEPRRESEMTDSDLQPRAAMSPLQVRG